MASQGPVLASKSARRNT